MRLNEVNQCDLECPVLAYAAAEYRQDMSEAGIFGKLGIIATRSVGAIKQMVRTTRCPRSKVDVASWTPHPDCIRAVLEQQQVRQLDPMCFELHESQVLGPILGLPDGPERPAID